MQIKRSVLHTIVLQEIANRVKELREADEEKKDDKPVEVSDADGDKKDKEKKDKNAKGDGAKVEPQKSAEPKNTAEPKGKKPAGQELPAAEEPADAELEKDAAEDDGVEDAAEVTGGAIADQVAGKTVQSITMEPKSKVMPGAQELVITFSQIPDPLRVLVTKTGEVKFFFKGLHNTL